MSTTSTEHLARPLTTPRTALRAVGLDVITAVSRSVSSTVSRVVIVAALVVAASTACNVASPPDRSLRRDDSTAPAAGGDATASAASEVPKSGSSPTDAPRAGRKPVRLGDLHPPPSAKDVGAPYDPCTVLAWNDFPELTRPLAAKPRKPIRKKPGPNAAFDIACAFEANGPITVGTSKTSSGTPAEFSTWIVWGSDMNAKPPDSTPTRFGPAAGSLIPSTTTSGATMCTGLAQLTTGVAGLSIVNGKAPQLDTCDLVTDLLTRIATKHR